jgi:hypothetical protein
MRVVLSGLALAALTTCLVACGGPNDAAGPAAPDAAPAAPSEPGIRIPATAADSLTVLCGPPFTPDATAASLMKAFGANAVVPETRDGPEGEKVNVTAIYPGDATMRVEVAFANEEERTGLISVTIRGETSQWTGPAGLNLGDGIDTVQKLNGGKGFTLSGFGWDHGGYVTDWRGGPLQEPVPRCRTMVRFGIPDDLSDTSVMGEGLHASDEPAIRAATPFVQEIGIHWLDEHEP